MEQAETVEIAVMTGSRVLEERVRQGLELWGREMCVRVSLVPWSGTDSRRAGPAPLLFMDFSAPPSPAAASAGPDYAGPGEGTPDRCAAALGTDRPDRCTVAVCASSREAIRAYQWHPAACIPPDFTYARLRTAMDRCASLWRHGILWLDLPPLPMGRILYAEARGKETLLHTRSGVETVRVLLGKLADRLPSPPFFRCHSGFLLCFPALSALRGGEAVLADGSRIPVSRRYAGDLRRTWEAWQRDRDAFPSPLPPRTHRTA